MILQRVLEIEWANWYFIYNMVENVLSFRNRTILVENGVFVGKTVKLKSQTETAQIKKKLQIAFLASF